MDSETPGVVAGAFARTEEDAWEQRLPRTGVAASSGGRCRTDRARPSDGPPSEPVSCDREVDRITASRFVGSTPRSDFGCRRPCQSSTRRHDPICMEPDEFDFSDLDDLAARDRPETPDFRLTIRRSGEVRAIDWGPWLTMWGPSYTLLVARQRARGLRSPTCGSSVTTTATPSTRSSTSTPAARRPTAKRSSVGRRSSAITASGSTTTSSTRADLRRPRGHVLFRLRRPVRRGETPVLGARP